MSGQHYEYMTETFLLRTKEETLTHYMNKIAAYGWRLVTTDILLPDTVLMYFERPVEQDSE